MKTGMITSVKVNSHACLFRANQIRRMNFNFSIGRAVSTEQWKLALWFNDMWLRKQTIRVFIPPSLICHSVIREDIEIRTKWHLSCSAMTFTNCWMKHTENWFNIQWVCGAEMHLLHLDICSLGWALSYHCNLSISILMVRADNNHNFSSNLSKQLIYLLLSFQRLIRVADIIWKSAANNSSRELRSIIKPNHWCSEYRLSRHAIMTRDLFNFQLIFN